MTPKIYGGFDFGVYHSVVMEGKTEELSFTDQSLRAVRLMATTQEDQVEPLDHADHDMDGEHDFDEELIYDPDNLHAFQAFPECRIFNQADRIGSALCSVDGTSALGTRAMGMLQHPV